MTPLLPPRDISDPRLSTPVVVAAIQRRQDKMITMIAVASALVGVGLGLVVAMKVSQ